MTKKYMLDGHGFSAILRVWVFCPTKTEKKGVVSCPFFFFVILTPSWLREGVLYVTWHIGQIDVKYYNIYRLWVSKVFMLYPRSFGRWCNLTRFICSNRLKPPILVFFTRPDSTRLKTLLCLLFRSFGFEVQELNKSSPLNRQVHLG